MLNTKVNTDKMYSGRNKNNNWYGVKSIIYKCENKSEYMSEKDINDMFESMIDSLGCEFSFDDCRECDDKECNIEYRIKWLVKNRCVELCEFIDLSLRC